MIYKLLIASQGSFLMTQATARLMVENKIKNGSIVNISSIVGKVSFCVCVCVCVCVKSSDVKQMICYKHVYNIMCFSCLNYFQVESSQVRINCNIVL